MDKLKCLTAVGYGCVCLISAFAAVGAEPISYNRDVRPILSDKCFHCHGFDQGTRKGKFRLDSREDAVAKGAIVPGKPQESALVTRIFSSRPQELMPPPDAHKPLTSAQKELLRRWVETGAHYEKHWAYVPPVKPATPPGQNPIDALVRQRLRDLGLQPSPRADPGTLARRLYFDLTGLPPDPREVEAFEQDSSPEATSRLMEKLMASPKFGERMAIGWLDVVRFADTIGYHSDNPRNVWPYRDYVIRAFNENKPFDRFTREQLAGDLLPDHTPEQRIGSAFNRLLLTTEEGGAQPKDYEARMLTDRVRAVSCVWLGQTIGCAQCHDHKFDPITQRDFYALGAFFADIDEPILGQREPGMLCADEKQEAELKRLEDALARAQRELDAPGPEGLASYTKWQEAQVGAPQGPSSSPPPPEVVELLRKPDAQRDAKQKEQLFAYFKNAAPETAQLRKQLADARKAKEEFEAGIPRCLVSRTNTQPRVVRVLPRGNFLNETGEIVQPALPAYLVSPDAKPDQRRLNRLDLANWLVARDNPLTARVVMNRLWKQFFGLGLSRVLDDFGAQGELPPNQPLLDWLACEFMDSGWDLKHMIRLMVSSDCYQQTSVAAPGLRARDSLNRELAVQSRWRLEAELVRDNALAVSGLLVEKIGGPSVKPYQPDGYWENLNFPARSYDASVGPDQYRRGLYVWWQRSYLHPSLVAFDAPTREECAAERNRSNIPQQALVLLNDPTYVEASRALAGRILKEGGADTNSRLAWAWRQVLSRKPRPDEVQAIQSLLSRQLAEYQADPAAAQALIKVGQTGPPQTADPAELAAWTNIARVLLNLHETITRA
ncbi:MAG: PSD1 and planctomycete cytochrome C domain-containing protein [Verrucomicrobia bacterium]|nr:PSD1 and planctomycete cytochrome C domain-containing protein [Verrucomicrobiota bacterium]